MFLKVNIQLLCKYGGIWIRYGSTVVPAGRPRPFGVNAEYRGWRSADYASYSEDPRTDAAGRRYICASVTPGDSPPMP